MAARLRTSGVRAGTPSYLRLTEIRAGGTIAGPPRLRLTAIRASGTEDLGPRLRLTGIRAGGTIATVLDPIEVPMAMPVEPDQVHTIFVDPAVGSPTPDSIEWTISPSSVGIQSTGGTAWFRAPSAMPPGTSVTITARGILSGSPGPSVSVTIPVLPQTRWVRDPATGQWVGASRLS